MTITKANSKQRGVRFFYVLGDSGTQYVVAFVRREGMRRVTCNCPDFTYRRQTKRSGRYCKHIKSVLDSVRISKTGLAVVPNLVTPLRASLRMIEEARIMGRTVEDHIETRALDTARLADLEDRANRS